MPFLFYHSSFVFQGYLVMSDSPPPPPPGKSGLSIPPLSSFSLGQNGDNMSTSDVYNHLDSSETLSYTSKAQSQHPNNHLTYSVTSNPPLQGGRSFGMSSRLPEPDDDSDDLPPPGPRSSIKPKYTSSTLGPNSFSGLIGAGSNTPGGDGGGDAAGVYLLPVCDKIRSR